MDTDIKATYDNLNVYPNCDEDIKKSDIRSKPTFLV